MITIKDLERRARNLDKIQRQACTWRVPWSITCFQDIKRVSFGRLCQYVTIVVAGVMVASSLIGSKSPHVIFLTITQSSYHPLVAFIIPFSSSTHLLVHNPSMITALIIQLVESAMYSQGRYDHVTKFDVNMTTQIFTIGLIPPDDGESNVHEGCDK